MTYLFIYLFIYLLFILSFLTHPRFLLEIFPGAGDAMTRTRNAFLGASVLQAEG
jgi:uncharacterized membrane protein